MPIWVENNRKIWKYMGLAAALAAVCLLCWYFRSILVYVACAVVVSLIGRPLKRALCRIRVAGHDFPLWMASVLTICVILGFVSGVVVIMSPIVTRIAVQVSSVNIDSLLYPLASFNSSVVKMFPGVGPDFRIEVVVLSQLEKIVNVGTISSVVTSVSGFLVDAALGVFSVAFMSYFFISDEGLLTNTIVSLAPDKYENKIRRASSRTTGLLSRYFIGLLIESICIMTLNTLGLTLIGGMPTSTAVTVAALTGVLNVIPYVGPLAGELLAVMMGMVTHADCSFSGSLGFFLLVLFLICLSTQLIDNYVFQPVIYSSSVKAHPMEIFIVILMAAKLWGVVGLLVAIPGYTVLRVALSEFFPEAKFVKVLTQTMQK